MKDYPVSEKPYEKCLENGAGNLSDAELLAVILRTGSKGEPAVRLARSILEQAGRGSLLGIIHISAEELMLIRGVGRVKAVQIKCIAELARRIAKQQASYKLEFHDPGSIADYYMEDFRHKEQEQLLLIMLNSKGALIGEEIISKGTVNSTLISPREVFITALKYQAVSVILLHNHPSGNPQPSREDLLMTKRMKNCGELLGIEVLDHIIIGDQKAVSFREENLL